MDESFLSWLVEVQTYDNNYIYEKIFISESPQQLARLNKSSYMVVGLEPHMTRLSSTLSVPIQKTENLIYLLRWGWYILEIFGINIACTTTILFC